MNLPALLERMKELDAKATPGPMEIIRYDWECGDINYQIEPEISADRKHIVFASTLNKKSNAEFIAAARTLLPLAAQIIERMDKALDEIEQMAGFHDNLFASDLARDARAEVRALVKEFYEKQ